MEPWTAPDGKVFQPTRNGLNALKAWFAEVDNINVDMPDWFYKADSLLHEKAWELFEQHHGNDVPV